MSFKKYFPCFSPPFDKGYIYFDNASTTQKPRQVIDAVAGTYQRGIGNPGRGLHGWATRSENIWENTREEVARFLGGVDPTGVVLNTGTTQGINQVAWGFLANRLQAGEEVWAAQSEHHSNLLPWKKVCDRAGAHLRLIPLDDLGRVDMSYVKAHWHQRVAFVACAHISNVLGVSHPIEALATWTSEKGVPFLVDAAQSAGHTNLDIPQMGGDFWVFSGHKLYAPAGIGVLYVAPKWRQQMEPSVVGGGGVRTPWFPKKESVSWSDFPRSFEVGTLNVSAAKGLSAALHFIEKIGFDQIKVHEKKLLTALQDRLKSVPQVRLLYPDADKQAICSFYMTGTQPTDPALWLATQQIAVRSGVHCAGPLHEVLNLYEGSLRVSFAIYNELEEIDAFIAALTRFLDFKKRVLKKVSAV